MRRDLCWLCMGPLWECWSYPSTWSCNLLKTFKLIKSVLMFNEIPVSIYGHRRLIQDNVVCTSVIFIYLFIIICRPLDKLSCNCCNKPDIHYKTFNYRTKSDITALYSFRQWPHKTIHYEHFYSAPSRWLLRALPIPVRPKKMEKGKNYDLIVW